MQLDLTSNDIVAWLGQFKGGDESTARRLLENITYVTADAFGRELSGLILSLPNGTGEPIALYAERKLKARFGLAHRLFKESRTKIKRAYGAGPPPVRSQHSGRHETGSEGIVANLITQIRRRRTKVFFDHPGPDLIRRRKIRRFVLVTDFIGTGAQSSQYLDAAWRLASTKSWWSGKFLTFEVVCYAATPEGVARIRNHRCRPIVRQVIACPTLSDLAPYGTDDVRLLCERFGPFDSETDIPRLGYGNVGALIAFAHGMPNNAPRLLFKKGRKWEPLFPARVTSAVKPINFGDKKAQIAQRLERLREINIGNLMRRSGLDPCTDLSILVLAALKKPPRTAEVVSARTGLGLAETANALRRARDVGWIDRNNKLTPNAYRELNFLRTQQEKKLLPYLPNDTFYFPHSLRAPVERFS